MLVPVDPHDNRICVRLAVGLKLLDDDFTEYEWVAERNDFFEEVWEQRSPTPLKLKGRELELYMQQRKECKERAIRLFNCWQGGEISTSF